MAFSLPVMKDFIRIETNFNGTTQHGAYMQHLLHRWKWWLLVRALVCFAAILTGVLWYAPGAEGKSNLIAAFLITVGCFGFVRPMVWQMWHERQLRKHPAYAGKVVYKFDREGVDMKGKAGAAKVEWSAFLEVVQRKKGLLIYQDKKQYIWIPVTEFEDGDMEAIVQLFEASKR